MVRLSFPTVVASTFAFLALRPLAALAQPAAAPPPPVRPAPAAAQPTAAPPAARQPAAGQPTTGQPAAGQPGAAQAAPGPTTLKPLEVNDASLSPLPAAPRTLASWKDALTLIDRSTAELVIAEQEVVRAEGLSRQALGGALPSVNASASANHNVILGSLPPQIFQTPAGLVTVEPQRTTSRASASLTVTQPILAPRVWYGIGTAKRSVEVARYSLDDRRRVLLAGVADNVVSVVTAERVSEINRVGLRSSLERLELTRRRERLGTGTKLDVVRAEQDVALARATLVSGDESLQRTREALGLALGQTEPYGVPPTISLNAIEQEIRSVCAPTSPEQRADVRAARTELEISERTVTDTKLAYLPTAEVSTSLSVTRAVPAASAALGNSPVWSIQGVLSIPIWDGGSRYGATRAAQASLEQQRARLGATARAAQLDAAQAMRSVSVAEQSRAVSEQSRDLARETARLTQVAFEAGTVTSFDLVDSGRRQREAELDLAVKEFQLVKAKIAALLASAGCTK